MKLKHHLCLFYCLVVINCGKRIICHHMNYSICIEVGVYSFLDCSGNVFGALWTRFCLFICFYLNCWRELIFQNVTCSPTFVSTAQILSNKKIGSEFLRMPSLYGWLKGMKKRAQSLVQTLYFCVLLICFHLLSFCVITFSSAGKSSSRRMCCMPRRSPARVFYLGK